MTEDAAKVWKCDSCENIPSDQDPMIPQAASQSESEGNQPIPGTSKGLTAAEIHMRKMEHAFANRDRTITSSNREALRITAAKTQGMAISKTAPTLGNLILQKVASKRNEPITMDNLPLMMRFLATEPITSESESEASRSRNTTYEEPSDNEEQENIEPMDHQEPSTSSAVANVPTEPSENTEPQVAEWSENREPRATEPAATEPTVNQEPGNSNAQPNVPEEGPSDNMQQKSPRKRYFVIEKIVDHVTYKRNDHEFRVRWEGYPASEDRWYKEKDLQRAYRLLAEYKARHKLGDPIIKRLYGSTDSKPGNINNWNTAERIIQTAKGYLTKEERSKLPINVITYPQRISTAKDGIYLIDYENHIIPGLYTTKSKTLTVSDGENLYLNDPATRSYLDKWFKIPIKAVKFLNQTRVDHCSSTAAIIIVKMMQQYAVGIEPSDILVAPRAKHEEIKRSLHPEPSECISGHKTGAENVTKYMCGFPGCNYYSKKRSQQQLNLHRIAKHSSK